MEEDESEWEYEYHETETEDFYVTLDLSSHSKPFGQGIKQPPNVSAGRKSAARPAQTTASVQADEASPSNKPADPAQTSIPINPILLTQTAPHPKRIQILDLHSHNPLISYNSQLYSCEWMSTLGTDMIFAAVAPTPPTSTIQQPDVESASASPAGSSAALLATTRLKLSARPVDVVPREPNAPSLTSAPRTNPSTGINTTIHSAFSETRQNQEAFLNRLAEIKRAKGETDNVPIYAGQGQGQARPGTSGSRARNNERGEDENVEGEEDEDANSEDYDNDDNEENDIYAASHKTTNPPSPSNPSRGRSSKGKARTPTSRGKGSNLRNSNSQGKTQSKIKKVSFLSTPYIAASNQETRPGARERAMHSTPSNRWQDLNARGDVPSSQGSNTVMFAAAAHPKEGEAGGDGWPTQSTAAGAGGDWTQRLSEHLLRQRHAVRREGVGDVHADGDDGGNNDEEEDVGDDVEMGDDV